MEFLDLLKTIQALIPPSYGWVSQIITDLFPWLLLGMALLLCFFGHKIHKIWLTVLFFGLGVLVGVITGAFLTTAFPQLNLWVSLLPPLVLGVLGAVFSGRLHKLQDFLVNAALVYAALPGMLARYIPHTPALLIGLGGAVFVGVLAVKYKYLVTIVTTTVSGALTAGPMIIALVKVNSLPVLLAIEGGLVAAGLTVQFLQHRHTTKKEEKPAAP